MTREEELEIQAEEERKQKKVEYAKKSRKKTFSIIFMCIVSILSAVVACAVLVAFLIGVIVLLNKIFGSESSVAGKIYSVLMPVSFIGAIALGVVLYKIFARLFIRNLGLQKKLPEDIYDYFMVKKNKKGK